MLRGVFSCSGSLAFLLSVFESIISVKVCFCVYARLEAWNESLLLKRL